MAEVMLRGESCDFGSLALKPMKKKRMRIMSARGEEITAEIDASNTLAYKRPHWLPHSIVDVIDHGEMQKEPILELKGHRLQIHVMPVTGREIKVETTPFDTALDLKKKIFNKENVPVDQQRLIFGGWHLFDGAIVTDQVNAILANNEPRLVEYSIETDSMPGGLDTVTIVHDVKIALVLRLRGGCKEKDEYKEEGDSSDWCDCFGDCF